MISVYGGVQGPTSTPAMVFEVRYGLQVGDRP
jgi:hypothetical protein